MITLMTNSPAYFYTIVVVFSLLIGSFLNVVIYRLPKMLEQGWKSECREFLADELAKPIQVDESPITLSTPSSSCPKCQHKIRFYENIPVISWVFLKGKCSQCKVKISLRYPMVELATAMLSVVIAANYGVTFTTFMLLVLTWGLICLTLIDVDHMLLPDQITLPLLWLGLLVNINGAIVPLHDAVVGAVAGYMSLFSIFWLFKLITGKDGMGHGDFKLVALFGAWIGWQLLPLLILMASAVGAVIGISLMVFKNHQREQAIPFGPYLAVAGWITLLWGNGIWTWYLSTLT
ncbi:A24 family peptidase [Colwellia sp. Arc7-D]|jgi:leader peptidase (prepilin peptidase)/N-methyltransferase|uniref:prepilin peptidase n=1 Tax=Colwellia sp. Arc7-D TaxID=2161872 RepID=UPI000D3722DB|nr:A24 family peptidase [Colwellia sp. Arc7-D]AWB59604.1 prepilin peptidase [Colwellia sp. Arc7-D]